jgi:hypothetical protein
MWNERYLKYEIDIDAINPGKAITIIDYKHDTDNAQLAVTDLTEDTLVMESTTSLSCTRNLCWQIIEFY